MMTADPAILNRIPLFFDLHPAELATLGTLLRCRTVPPETVVMREDEPGEAVFIIANGFVRVQVHQADGASTILAILGPNEIVGEMSLVDRLGRSATVVAHESSTHYSMSRATFWTCLRTMPTLTYNLAGILSRRLRSANEQIEAFATLSVEARVARQLLVFAEEYGEVLDCGVCIPFRLSQSEVAGMVGASRVRVNQALVDYRRQGYVSLDERGRLIVRDTMALADRCRYCG